MADTIDTLITNIENAKADIQETIRAKGVDVPGGVALANTAAYVAAIPNTTYTLSKSGSTITLTGSDGSTSSVSDSNTTYTFNGAVSTIKDSNLTASRALISNGSGKVAVSPVTSTELGYLDGVTSAIQTQLNNRSTLNTEQTFTALKSFDVGLELGKYQLGVDGFDAELIYAPASSLILVDSNTDGNLIEIDSNDKLGLHELMEPTSASDAATKGYVDAEVAKKAASGHTHTTSIAESSGTNQLTLAHGKKYALNAGGTSYIFTMPSDNNTHYTTGFYIGAKDAKSNAATNNGSTYLKLYDDSTRRSQFLIKGEGATSVTSDSSGNITISSTNSVYDDSDILNRLGVIEAKPGLDKTGTVTSVKVGSTSYNPSSGVVSLPAYPSVPSSLKNPNAVTIQAGGATVSSYDGSAAKTFNIAASTTAGAFTISDGTTTKTVQLAGKFTDNNTTYSVAKYNVLGLLKPAYTSTGAVTLTTAAATNAETPTISAKTTNTGRYYAVEADKNGIAYVNVPWSNTTTQIGMVGNSTLSPTSGDIIFKAGTNVSLAHQYSGGQQNITINATDTTYNAATTSTLGLVKSTTTGTTSGRDYAVQVNSDGTMKVNVPWTDTNTNTTNTTGTTEKASTKLFLAGATSQASAPQTFSNAKVYIGTDNCLYSNGSKVATQAAVDDVAAIANGKTRTYVLSYTPTDSSCNGNSVFNSNSDTIDLSQSHKTQLIDGTILNMSTGLKIGDIILVKETNVPDRWIMSVNGQGTFTLAKMETSKVDLAPYSENTHTHSVPAPTITVTGQSYTPAGSVSSSFTGTAATISVSGTPAGTIKTGTGTANYTPAGSVTVTPNTTTVNSITAVGSLPSLTTETVEAISSATLTAGTTPVSSATFSGTAATSGANSGTGVSAVNASLANGVLTITAVTAAPNSHTHSVTAKGSITLTRGTAPSLSTTPTSFEAVESWSAGTLPTKGSNTTVVTGIKSASFSGTGTQLLFTGSSLTSTGSYTPGGTVSSTWAGTAATIKPTVTASSTTTGKAST